MSTGNPQLLSYCRNSFHQALRERILVEEFLSGSWKSFLWECGPLLSASELCVPPIKVVFSSTIWTLTSLLWMPVLTSLECVLRCNHLLRLLSSHLWECWWFWWYFYDFMIFELFIKVEIQSLFQVSVDNIRWLLPSNVILFCSVYVRIYFLGYRHQSLQ